MMFTQLHLILTMVNFALTSESQTIHQAALVSKVNVENGIEENFENLFDLISQNDKRNSETYHEILKQDAAKKKAFDVMREELLISQNKNAEKKMNFFKKFNVNVRPAKREANESNLGLNPDLGNTTRREYDEKFVELYGTDRMTSGVWDVINQFPVNEAKLLQLAGEAHRLAGMGDVRIGFAVKESRWLDFYNLEKYNPIMIDILVYSIEGHVKSDTRISYFYYITKGLRPDCVFYLTKDNLLEFRLKLDKHVCGLLMPLA